MEIDITPVLEIVIDLLAAALMTLGGWALAKLVIERVPDAVDHFGLDRERIKKLVEAHLAGA